MTACRAPELTVKVLAETRRKIKKVFFNKYVERLVVSAPCNFNLHLAMAALKVSFHSARPLGQAESWY